MILLEEKRTPPDLCDEDLAREHRNIGLLHGKIALTSIVSTEALILMERTPKVMLIAPVSFRCASLGTSLFFILVPGRLRIGRSPVRKPFRLVAQSMQA